MKAETRRVEVARQYLARRLHAERTPPDHALALRYETPAVDAISCSVPVARLTPQHEREIIPVMLAARARIENAAPPVTAGSGRRSGYRPDAVISPLPEA